jgi:hypothetical protein
MFHLAAYSSSITNEGDVTAVTDMYLPSNSNGFLLPSPMKIVAAYATAAEGALAATAGLMGAAITAPSLARVAYPYIRPVSHNVGELTDPNVMNLISNPITLPASDFVGIHAFTDGTSTAYALLWLCDQLSPVPAGEKFTLRFTATASTTAQVWSAVGTVKFDQSLPPGAYTVVGFEHWSPNAIAARLVFPGMHMRPGTLSMAGTLGTGNRFPSNKRTDRIFYEGGLGVYGTFNSFAPPSIEVLASANGTNSAHEGYLTLIRTGDATPLPQMGGLVSGGSPTVIR